MSDAPAPDVVDVAHPQRALALAAVLLGAVALGAQLPGWTPPILTGSDRSMHQYEAFRAHVARDGPHDVVFIGNSFTRQGVDVPHLLTLLPDREAGPLRVFNFGAGGTSVLALPVLAALVYGIDHPEHCVFVVTPQMFFTRSRRERSRADLVRRSPYGVALADPIPWRGELQRALLDHVSLFGLRYAMKDALLGRATRPREPGGYQPTFGYQPSEETELAPWQALRLEHSRRRKLSQDLDLDTEVDALVRAAQVAARAGARVSFLEGALHPETRRMIESEGTGLAEVRAALLRAGGEVDAAVHLVPDSLVFPADLFADGNHLNGEGARVYTRWVAETLALAAPAGPSAGSPPSGRSG